MDHPVNQEQEREHTVMRIFEAALEHISTNGYDAMEISNTSDGHASSSSLDLVRHIRSIVDEIPPSGIDEDYVLRLQSKLAIALCTIERQEDQLHEAQSISALTVAAPTSRPVLSARQLAESASRRQRRVSHRNSELGEALTMAASLSIDLERTRERMSDAISVTRSRSNSTRSLSLMDALDLENDEVEDVEHHSVAPTTAGITPNMNDDLVTGPFIGSLNDIELNDVEDEVPTNAPTRSTTRAGTSSASQGQVEEMLTSIATLEFDLFQTREQLADERTFTKSSGSLQTLIAQQDTADLDGHYDIVDTTQAEEQEEPLQADTTSGSNALAPSTSTTTSIPNAKDTTNSQVDSSVSSSNNTTRVPKTDSMVQETRMHPSLLRRRSYTNRSA